MMIELNLEKIRANVRAATTPDLMDRATFYRAGMEPEALEIIDAELTRRGVKAEDLEAWGPRPGEDYVWLDDGTIAPCTMCRKPAVRQVWGWHRLWGTLPLFPRRFRYCRAHDPETPDEQPPP